MPLHDFARVRLGDFFIVIIDQPAVGVKRIFQTVTRPTCSSRVQRLYLTSCTASCTYMHIASPNKLCHNGSRVQWAAFAAGLGLDEPMKRDVVREDKVFFNVAAVKNFQVKYTAS